MKKRILMIGAGKGLSISIRLLQKDKKLKICGFIPRLDKNFKIYKKEFFTPHKYNFPVYKIKNINEEKILIKLRKMKIDLICCWGYNRLLTKNLLNISKLGCLNLHPGLLPYGRGTGALVGEILNNSQYLGQTCHLMNEKFDSGEIISVRKMKFSGDEYLNEITKKLDYKTPEFFVKSIYKCLSNKFKRKKMKSFGRYFPKLSPSDEIVDWNKNSSYILKKIRSRSPELLSKSYILPSKKVFFIKEIEYSKVKKYHFVPGQVLDNDKKLGVLVKTSDTALWLKKISYDKKNFFIPKFKIGTSFLHLSLSSLYEFFK